MLGGEVDRRERGGGKKRGKVLRGESGLGLHRGKRPATMTRNL